MVKILVMGLPGSGKTTFSQELVKRLSIENTIQWFNADAIRKHHNDWDFTPEGRQRQAVRMALLADESSADYVICDFVCPTEYFRLIFDADFVIWMDTIKEGRFEDTNKLFETPTLYDVRVTDWQDHWVDDTAALILSSNSSQQ
jgi:adenylylsulfate kinase